MPRQREKTVSYEYDQCLYVICIIIILELRLASTMTQTIWHRGCCSCVRWGKHPRERRCAVLCCGKQGLIMRAFPHRIIWVVGFSALASSHVDHTFCLFSFLWVIITSLLKYLLAVSYLCVGVWDGRRCWSPSSYKVMFNVLRSDHKALFLPATSHFFLSSSNDSLFLPQYATTHMYIHTHTHTDTCLPKERRKNPVKTTTKNTHGNANNWRNWSDERVIEKEQERWQVMRKSSRYEVIFREKAK